jgi:hypothetical protein
MKTKMVSITYGRKFNLGNYNSAEVGLTVWADVDDGESGAEVVAELQRQARESVKREFMRLARVAEDPSGNGAGS